MPSQEEVSQHYIPSRRPGCMHLLLAASKQVTTREHRHLIRLSCLLSQALIIAKLALAEGMYLPVRSDAATAAGTVSKAAYEDVTNGCS